MVRQLTITLKQLMMYSCDHPAVQAPMGHLHDTFQRFLSFRPSISFSEAEGRLLVDSEPYPGIDPAVTWFSRTLPQSGVGIVTFSRGMDRQGMELFLKVMAQKLSAPEAEAGIGPALEQQRVSGIKVEAVKYSRAPAGIDLLEDAVIMDFLQARGKEADLAGSAEALRKDPERLVALTLKLMTPGEAGGVSEGSLDAGALRGLYERLEKNLFPGQPGEWKELKRKIAYALIMNHPQLRAEVDKFQHDVASGFEELGKTLTPSLYKEMAARLVTASYCRGIGAPEEIRQVMSCLVPDLEEQQELLEVIKTRSGEWGLDEEKFRLLEEEVQWRNMSLEERAAILRNSSWADPRTYSNAKELLPLLLEQGRVEDVSGIVENFALALANAGSGEVPRYLEQVSGFVDLLAGCKEGEVPARRVLGRLLDLFKEEQDPERAGQLLRTLLDNAATMMRTGKADEGCHFFCLAVEEAASSSDWKRGLLNEAISGPAARECILGLVDRLKDPGLGYSAQVERMLRPISERAAPLLMERLVEEQDTASRARLLKLLSKLGPAAGKAALPYASDPRWFVVRNVAHIIGQVRLMVDEGILGAMLSHTEPRVRKEAIRCLMAIGPSEALRLVVPLTRDPDEGVQQEALEALASSGKAELIQPLLELVRTSPGPDPSSQPARIRAVQALGNARCTQAVPALVAVVSEKSALRYKESQELRLAAAAALGNIGGEEATACLKDVSRDFLRCEKPVREATERALAQARRGPQ